MLTLYLCFGAAVIFGSGIFHGVLRRQYSLACFGGALATLLCLEVQYLNGTLAFGRLMTLALMAFVSSAAGLVFQFNYGYRSRASLYRPFDIEQYQ